MWTYLYSSNSQVIQFSSKTVHTFYETASSLHLDTRLLARTKSYSILQLLYKFSRLALNIINSLRGRRSKGKGDGIRARDHARGTAIYGRFMGCTVTHKKAINRPLDST